MERKDENSMILSIGQKPMPITPHDTNDNDNNKTTPSLKKGKRSKNIFKVALFMMRGRSRKAKALAVDDESKSMWRKIVGSMRPLHLQSMHSPTRDNNNNNNNIIPQPNKKMITLPLSENGDEGFDSASEFVNSPSPSSSRYASAVGLNEMVQEEEEKVEEVGVEKENDDDIDAKAEEFIAQFYHEMRLQRLDVMDRHYKEISMRSLGLYDGEP